MARTLADMPPDEQDRCVGMWAKIDSRNALFIIDSVDSDAALIFSPGESSDTGLMDLNFITPQFDLPRAWEPDGTPSYDDIETAEVSLGHVYFDGSERVKFPDGTTVCRFVGEWWARDKAG